MPLDPRDRRRNAQGRSLRRARSHGHTARPRGSGGNDIENVEIGQWAQSRYIGYYASQVPPIDRPPTRVTPLLNDAGVGCERSQYVVSVSAGEQRFPAPFIGPDFAIPSRQDVLNRGPGLSQLQVLVQWSLGAARNNQLELDIGAGFQLSLPARSLQMGLILPDGAFDIDGRVGQQIPLGPVDPITGAQTAFHAALVWGEVSRMGTYSSTPEWQLTRGLFVPATQTVTVDVPVGADFVEVFQLTSPAGATPFLRFVTAPQPTPQDVGQFSFDTTSPRYTGRVRIPGQADAIDSGPVDNLNDRFFSVVFTMRP